MKNFYHATTNLASWKKIKREGLFPSTEHIGARIKPGVYLSDDPFWATMFGEVVLKVYIPDRSLLYAPRWGSPWEYLYRGHIPPSYIKFFSRSEPLRKKAEREKRMISNWSKVI